MSVAWSVLAVACGGALGALVRWAVTVGLAGVPVGRWSGFPVGTLVVNVVGTFALAFLLARGVGSEASPALRLFLATGFLGALTTFSTFGVDVQGLLQQDRAAQAALYVGGTLTLAGIAVLLGAWLGR